MTEEIKFYQTGIRNLNETIKRTPLTDPRLFHYFETLVRFENLLQQELQPKKPNLFKRLKNLIN